LTLSVNDFAEEVEGTMKKECDFLPGRDFQKVEQKAPKTTPVVEVSAGSSRGERAFLSQ